MSRRIVSQNFHTENQSGFQIMQIYVKFMLKFPYFEPTLDYITLRNFGMVHPICTKIASKVAQDSKEKSCESAVRRKNFSEIIAWNVEGGGGWIHHPPGPIRSNPQTHGYVNTYLHFNHFAGLASFDMFLFACFMSILPEWASKIWGTCIDAVIIYWTTLPFIAYTERQKKLITSSECHSLKFKASTWIIFGDRLGEFILNKHILKKFTSIQEEINAMKSQEVNFQKSQKLPASRAGS